MCIEPHTTVSVHYFGLPIGCQLQLDAIDEVIDPLNDYKGPWLLQLWAQALFQLWILEPETGSTCFVIASPVVPNRRWCSHRQLFLLIGAHQPVWCTDGGVGMTGLPMYPPPVQDLWFQTIAKADREAIYSLQDWHQVEENLTSVTLEGEVEWLITGSSTPNQLAAL